MALKDFWEMVKQWLTQGIPECNNQLPVKSDVEVLFQRELSTPDDFWR